MKRDGQPFLGGDLAKVAFRSTKDGNPIQSAIGVSIVDESVFALGEQEAGFARLYFLLQKELLENQKNVEERAMVLYKHNSKEVSNYLTEYTISWGDKVVKRCWQLGDFLWTKYDEKF